MRQLSSYGRRLVAAVLAVVVIASLATWLALEARGADDPEVSGASSLPDCADLLGTDLGPLGEDPAWNGCLTGSGAAVPSYRYECSALAEVLVPSGEEQPLADEAGVVFVPDAGLLAVTGKPWFAAQNSRQAYLRTPFALLSAYRCAELRSLPHDGMSSVGCDLDDIPLDLVTTQGCSVDGRRYTAVGRTCGYVDGDQGTTWEQWSIEVPGLPASDRPVVLETGPDEQWQMVPGEHRDERCSTSPGEWDPAWR